MELANRECIVKVSSNGRVLPAFKAKTLDFIPIPSKRKDFSKKMENNKITLKLPRKENFNINPNINLKDIMASQSSGRKRVTNE